MLLRAELVGVCAVLALVALEAASTGESTGATGWSGSHADQGTMASIRSSVLKHMLPRIRADVPERWDEEVAFIMRHLRSSNGTFDDIDYSDYDGRSWWKTSVHLQRCLILGISHKSPLSTHHNSSAVYDALILAFEAWLKADFKNSNWWWMDIGVPRIVAKLLLLVTQRDAERLHPLAAPLMDRGSISRAYDMTACNRVWLASANVLRALTEGSGVRGNATRLTAAYAAAGSAIAVQASQKSDGIQPDHSFHQHGPQLYMGWGYGSIMTANVLLLANYAQGTGLVFSNATWDVFAAFVLDGQRLVVHGPNVDYTTSGRLMTYFALNDTFGLNHGHYHYFAAFTDFRLSFPTFAAPLRTPLSVVFAPLLPEVAPERPRAAEFHAFAREIYRARTGGGLWGADPREPQLRASWHFYDSDYVVHHRPSFFASVRMFSNRTINTECGNSENLRGRDLADAVLNVYVSGREYENVFPVWEWHRIPGTTEHQTGTPYSCADVHDVRHTSFVGGATDRFYSVSAMNFTRGHAFTLYVSKTHVFLDGAILVLLGGLTSNAPYNITTSLDQSNLRSEVVVGARVGDAHMPHEQRILPAGTNTTLRGPAWVWHGDIGYSLSLSSLEEEKVKEVVDGKGEQKAKEDENEDEEYDEEDDENGGPQHHQHQQHQEQQQQRQVRPLMSRRALEVVVSTKNQSGSWANITQGPPTPVTRPVFNAFINHGVAVGQAPQSLAYAILPGVTSASDMASADASLRDRVHVLSNTRHAQAVCVVDDADGRHEGERREAHTDRRTATAAGGGGGSKSVIARGWLAGGNRVMAVVSWPNAQQRTFDADHAGCWNVSLSGPALFQMRASKETGEIVFAVNNPMVERRPLALSINVAGLPQQLSCHGPSSEGSVALEGDGSTRRFDVTLPEGTGASVSWTCTF